MLAIRIYRLKLRLNAKIKYLLSFAKDSWTIDDYPLLYKNQSPPKDAKNPESYPPWTVMIVGWFNPFGFGKTREEAYNDLNQKIELFRTKYRGTPRPGTKVPIMAIRNPLDAYKHREIARKFFRDVLQTEPFIISDVDSLFDFDNSDISQYLTRIKEVFGVDVSDIEDANLEEIYDRLIPKVDHVQSD